MILTKKQREKLKCKYGGNCSYCGDPLAKKWHADHIIPIRRNPDGTCENPEADNFENLTPSCPSCNRMKDTLTIEKFRKLIENFINSLNNNSTQYKFAKRYNLVKETNAQVLFHFEKCEPTEEYKKYLNSINNKNN